MKMEETQTGQRGQQVERMNLIVGPLQGDAEREAAAAALAGGRGV